MTTAMIKFVSPLGTPITLTIAPGDDRELIVSLLERADAIGQHYHVKHGWHFAEAAPTAPTAQELGKGPIFCGYTCSPTLDERGYPSWILVDGRQAVRREKQGDVWYSIKADNEYIQVLRIPKGEKAPPVQGL